jgi:peptidoglycan hydrolase-like protein with peptidoglycan-binding domain
LGEVPAGAARQAVGMMSRTRTTVVAMVALAGVAAAAWLLVTRRSDSRQAAPAAVTTGTVAVRRATVAQRQQVNGTLGYAQTYTVIAPGPGLLTRLPAAGTVISRGQAVYEADGQPVILMYGARPSWRAFQPGMADGLDVRQLETNLKELGYGAGLTVDQHFNTATYNAVRRWQAAAGLPVTGSVPLGQVVFLPGPLRISGSDHAPGERIEPAAPVEHATSDQQAVTVQLSPQQLPMAKVGDPVVVTLPDTTTRAGTITGIGAVATTPSQGSSTTGGGQSTAPVTVHVDGTVTGFLDQAQVQVAITVAAHANVLTVPITALNAIPGGYEVIVVDQGTTRRIAVETGLFDEFAGLAEVRGSGLAKGQLVRVPRDAA